LLIGKLLNSPIAYSLSTLPPFAWGMRTITRHVARQQLGKHTPALSLQQKTAERFARDDIQTTLDDIAYDVVETLGYAVAMVATYEKDDSLSSRAFYIDPHLASMDQVHAWEQQVAHYAPPDWPISITNPEFAKVFVHRNEYQDNLSVQAARGGEPVISNRLYDLFVPVAPYASQSVVDGIQRELGVQQVIALPFFLEHEAHGQTSKELVGNMYAMKRDTITEKDFRVLSAFGRQAASAILSERQRLQIQISQELVFEIQNSLQSENQILQRIAEGVVSKLGYVGCMVAPYESDDTLPVRAFSIDPRLASMEKVHAWEDLISRYSHVHPPISLDNPDVARVYVHQDRYRDNLSVVAARAGKPVTSDYLYDLFVPIVAPISRPIVDAIQQELEIRQVIAAPFFLDTMVDGQPRRELFGNLFAFTRSRRFSSGEIELLQAFGRQAAVGLRNARLYRQSELRREVSQVFGRMAFSASASVHALKNHIGAVRLNLQMLDMVLKNPDDFPEAERAEIFHQFERESPLFARLDDAAQMLDSLHEPWRHTADVQTSVNASLRRAMSKLKLDPDHTDWVHVALAEELPAINTSPDMLTEALKVLLKNAIEAVHHTRHERSPELWIESAWQGQNTIRVSIRDNGDGIRPEDLSKVFEMRWTTKADKGGMGFGLFWTKDYIEGLGGTIDVESIWQEGTTFRIVLPVSLQQTLAQQRAEPIARHQS
jgi:signal transduction histidine kinase